MSDFSVAAVKDKHLYENSGKIILIHSLLVCVCVYVYVCVCVCVCVNTRQKNNNNNNGDDIGKVYSIACLCRHREEVEV